MLFMLSSVLLNFSQFALFAAVQCNERTDIQLTWCLQGVVLVDATGQAISAVVEGDLVQMELP